MKYLIVVFLLLLAGWVAEAQNPQNKQPDKPDDVVKVTTNLVQIDAIVTDKNGRPVADLEEHPEVNVTYSDPGKDSYVSISGAARVVEDLERKKAMWNTAAQAWFPGGPTDPNLALVAVLVAEAEYWDVKSNQAVQIFKMAKAAITGEPPKDMGEHRRVRM